MLRLQADLPYSYADVGATATTVPNGYLVDRNRVQLGQGLATFTQACAAMRRWTMFDLGWIDLLWPDSPIVVGTTVGILAHLPGLHILNACRIVYVVDEELDGVTCFGFAYGTLPGHIERGEERFLIEWHHADNSVWYDILAFSQPNHWLVKLGYPVTRYYQRRFARASLRAMLASITRRSDAAS
ncbi:MAG: DUF1990 domain-containing protein [Caldilineaceae bacterium]